MNQNVNLPFENFGKHNLDAYFTSYDIGRLEKYSNNMSDYHLIMDLIPPLARLYFLNYMEKVRLSPVQAAILLSLGLQNKTVDQVVEDLNKSSTSENNVLVASQILGLFNKIICKSTKYLQGILNDSYSSTFNEIENSEVNIEVSAVKGAEMKKELDKADKELKKKQKHELQALKQSVLEQYAIKGSETEWSNALSSNKTNKSLLSVKSLQKKIVPSEENLSFQEPTKKKKNNKRKHSF